MNSVMQKPLSIDINNNDDELSREADKSSCSLSSSSTFSTSASSSSELSGDSFQEKLKEVTLDQMIRGQTPAGIEVRCLELCRSFIGGPWNEAAGVEEINVKRLSGGFTNQLYHVRLINVPATTGSSDDDDFPTEVAIKFYQPKHMKNYHVDDGERLNDVIILSMVSEMGITPKVYGIFQEESSNSKGGFLQEFVKHEQFVPKHQQIPKCLKGCAQLQAKIHSLKVPIRKDSSWIFRIMRECFQTAYDQCALQELTDQLQLDAFQKQPPLQEVDNLEKLATEVNSPLSFSHNDFNRTNVLVVEDGERVVTVDMEHCAYAPRAYDLATFLSEWDRELFAFHTVGLPDDAVLRQYVQLYLSAADQLQPGYASKAENSVEKIIKEVKIFILVRILFIIGVSIQMREAVIEAIPFSEELKMESCNNFFRTYLQVKEQLIEQGVIQKC